MSRLLIASDSGLSSTYQAEWRTLSASARFVPEIIPAAIFPRVIDAPVVLAASAEAIESSMADALERYVHQGGALFLLGSSAQAWLEHPPIRLLLGCTPADPTSATEIIVHPVSDHATTQRLDDPLVFFGRVLRLAAPPPDATPLLQHVWQYRPSTLAFVRPYGAGFVAYLGILSHGDSAIPPTLQPFVLRCLRYLHGWRETPPLGMALLGYGAIGLEHATAIAATAGLELRQICDRSAARLDAARQHFPDARFTPDAAAITGDSTVDTVIIGTPPNTHAQLALQMLRAGKHVIVEKPFCMTTAEADVLIETARATQRVLTVYQNRRWDPDFLAIRAVIAAGRIGDIVHLETFIGGFAHPCDYWHSDEAISGGVFYDWGSHYLDWILQLMPGTVQDVRATAHKRVWHDVTNADQANLVMRFTDGAEASFIHSDIAAILKPKWYILGTRGAIVGHWRHTVLQERAWNGNLIEHPLAPAEALPVITVAVRAAEGEIHEERLALPAAPQHPFHRNFADHVLAGAPLAVPPAAARRNIAVMEAAARSARSGSIVIPIQDEPPTR